MPTFVRANSIVTNLFETLRNTSILSWEQPNHGLHVVLHAYAAEHGYRYEPQTDGTQNEVHHEGWEKSVMEYLHVIVTSRHRLYVARSQEYLPEKVDIRSWKNASNHDSCWSSSLEYDTWYFWACDFVQENVPEEFKKAPALVQCEARLSGFAGAPGVRFVKIERAPREDNDHYFDKLTKVEELKYDIVVKE